MQISFSKDACIKYFILLKILRQKTSFIIFYIVESPSHQQLAISNVKDEVIILIVGVAHTSEFEPSGTSVKCIYRISKKENLLIDYLLTRIEQIVKRGTILCYILYTANRKGFLYDIADTINASLEEKRTLYKRRKRKKTIDFSYTVNSVVLSLPKKLKILCGNSNSYPVRCEVCRIGFDNGVTPYVLLGLNTKKLCDDDSSWYELQSKEVSVSCKPSKNSLCSQVVEASIGYLKFFFQKLSIH